ncbi:hypothetical protein VTN02DRAFT_5543 [Thermoascus thermophilus]
MIPNPSLMCKCLFLALLPERWIPLVWIPLHSFLVSDHWRFTLLYARLDTSTFLFSFTYHVLMYYCTVACSCSRSCCSRLMATPDVCTYVCILRTRDDLPTCSSLLIDPFWGIREMERSLGEIQLIFYLVFFLSDRSFTESIGQYRDLPNPYGRLVIMKFLISYHIIPACVNVSRLLVRTLQTRE